MGYHDRLFRKYIKHIASFLVNCQPTWPPPELALQEGWNEFKGLKEANHQLREKVRTQAVILANTERAKIDWMTSAIVLQTQRDEALAKAAYGPTWTCDTVAQAEGKWAEWHRREQELMAQLDQASLSLSNEIKARETAEKHVAALREVLEIRDRDLAIARRERDAANTRTCSATRGRDEALRDLAQIKSELGAVKEERDVAIEKAAYWAEEPRRTCNAYAERIRERDEALRELAQTKSELGAVKEERDVALAKRDRYWNKGISLQGTLDETTEKISKLTAECKCLRDERDELQARIEQLREVIDTHTARGGVLRNRLCQVLPAKKAGNDD